jgi:hypothetical protein
VVTSTGAVRLERRYFVCRSCGLGAHPLDEQLGLTASLSRQAERLVALAAASWSFDRSASLLEEFCGLKISDTTIRKYATGTGRQMRQWQRQSAPIKERFAQALGDIEFSTDGTFINTLQGWREVRLNIFAKRQRGEPATPAEWDDRALPAPQVRTVFGGIWSAEQLGPHWRAWAARHGIRDTEEITVLADGARWIWKQVDKSLPGAAGLLDIYHASEHLYQTANVLFGEGNAQGAEWVTERRQCLLEEGACGLAEALIEDRRRWRSPKRRASLDKLDDYFAPHAEHTAYRERLGQGQSIGSGMVEGACKTLVGKRLKQTGARWRIRHAERILALNGVIYSDLWSQYWDPSPN